jgi:hypothetical protein
MYIMPCTNSDRAFTDADGNDAFVCNPTNAASFLTIAAITVAMEMTLTPHFISFASMADCAIFAAIICAPVVLAPPIGCWVTPCIVRRVERARNNCTADQNQAERTRLFPSVEQEQAPELSTAQPTMQ